MDILNRLGLNVGNKDETNKGDRLYYAVAENYKMSSIELENIQLKDAINETMKASSEDFKGVVDKVKSGLSNIWEKILEIFKAIRKFIKSIIDKVFRRKIKKEIDNSKEVLNTVLKDKQSTSKNSTTNTNTKTPSKRPLLLKAPEYSDINRVNIYINKYFLDNHNLVRNKLDYFATTVGDYCEVLLEKKDADTGLIPGIVEYLNSGSVDGSVFFYFRKPENVKRKFNSYIESIMEIGKAMDSNKDNFIKVDIQKNSTLSIIKNNIEEIGKLYEYIDKKYRIIDKEIGNIIKRVDRMMKSKKKEKIITDKNRDRVSMILDATKALQGIISEGTKTTLSTLYKIAVLSRLSIASENSDRSYITK